MYLIVLKDSEPFLTRWFDKENNWVQGMVVFNLTNYTYTTDGENWNSITEDHL